MEGADEAEEFPPSLVNIVEQRELKWIFVGGKGGVGKTTTSCCLAIELAKHRENVLLISTDPAHNLSDAFTQRFSKTPLLVDGFENLYAMEIDPSADEDAEDWSDVMGSNSEEKKMLSGLAGAMPGIDEAMSFSNLMKLVQSMEFEVVVFDTAPTGHTLRFLQLPQTLLKSVGSLFGGSMGGLLSQMMGMMGGADTDARLSQTQEVIQKISEQFQDARLTTFVAVTLAEFLPLYETERLLQELARLNMDCRNLVVNQILSAEEAASCRHCRLRSDLQQRYLQHVDELYGGLYHITPLPAEVVELRGPEALKTFSPKLMQDFTAELVVGKKGE